MPKSGIHENKLSNIFRLTEGRHVVFEEKGKGMKSVIFTNPCIFVSNFPIPVNHALHRRVTVIHADISWEMCVFERLPAAHDPLLHVLPPPRLDVLDA